MIKNRKYICLVLILFVLHLKSESSAISITQDDELITPVIQIHSSEKDSIKYITARVNESRNDTLVVPIPEMDIYFYVQRTFSLLPIGEYFNTTDENGEVTIEFPGDLPGDSAGNVMIIARIEEFGMYNGAEITKVVNFGIPTDHNPDANRRSLAAASANAPVSLLILVNSIILMVWGFIIYIITQVFRIRRI